MSNTPKHRAVRADAPRVSSLSNKDLAAALARYAETIDDGRPPNPESKLREAARRLGTPPLCDDRKSVYSAGRAKFAVDYVDRFRFSLRRLCGRAPSRAQVVDWLKGSTQDLQTWVLEQEDGMPEYYQGIVVLDAAAILADSPPDGEDHLYPHNPFELDLERGSTEGSVLADAAEAIKRLVGALGSQIIDPDNDGDVMFARSVLKLIDPQLGLEMNSKQLRTFNLGAASSRAAAKQREEAQAEELKTLRLKAARYDLITENIDFSEDKEVGFYWHNQRGEFAYTLDATGNRPSFEEVIDAALEKRGLLP